MRKSKYKKAFVTTALKLSDSKGVKQAAAILDIAPNLIYSWRKRAAMKAEKKNDEPKTVEELREKLAEEREVLAKHFTTSEPCPDSAPDYASLVINEFQSTIKKLNEFNEAYRGLFK